MHIRPNVVEDDDYRPVSCAAASIEPLHRPDYKAKKHSRPRGEERRRWVRAPRKAWVEV
jgi:hypothetical protein